MSTLSTYPTAGSFMPGTTSAPVMIEDVRPSVDMGRWPVKREIGDTLLASAHVFKPGHGVLRAVLKIRQADQGTWTETPMQLENAGMDLWTGSAPLEKLGRWEFTVEAWEDTFASWRKDTLKKIEAGQSVTVDLIEGRDLAAAAIARATPDDAVRLRTILAACADDAANRAEHLTSQALADIMDRAPDRTQAVSFHPPRIVVVEPVFARHAAWYEMVPRSQGQIPNQSATFDDCIDRLPAIAAMGFDVLYLTPIHPIGRDYRKGANNTFPAQPGEPGSFYAVGAAEGGHTSIAPDLGSLDDFRRLVAEARRHGMEMALDMAIQCSPDHPWITEHPEWFEFRPDGTIKHAENPPKKYQDIVNLNFYGPHQEALWTALRDVFLFWVAEGVKIFRVDNPHTKPVPLWEWLIAEVKARHPECVFLAEAFTRPSMLKTLAKAGFSQSYTYFTWRNFKQELEQFATDMTLSECRDYLRPNLFPSTPDILPEFLQRGGRPAFLIRAALAATLSSVYGIYNGYELCENAAVPGTEEYLDSEKYQFKTRDWTADGNIIAFLTDLNRIRAENPALQELDNLRFHEADNEAVLFYSKTTWNRSNTVLCAVTLDPFEAQTVTLTVPLEALGIAPDAPYQVEDLLTGTRRLWRGARHALTLDPNDTPAALLRVHAWKTVDYVDPCY